MTVEVEETNPTLAGVHLELIDPTSGVSIKIDIGNAQLPDQQAAGATRLRSNNGAVVFKNPA